MGQLGVAWKRLVVSGEAERRRRTTRRCAGNIIDVSCVLDFIQKNELQLALGWKRLVVSCKGNEGCGC